MGKDCAVTGDIDSTEANALTGGQGVHIVTVTDTSASLHIAPVSRAMTQDRCGCTPGWTESHSHSYGLKEAQVQAYLDKSAPG